MTMRGAELRERAVLHPESLVGCVLRYSVSDVRVGFISVIDYDGEKFLTGDTYVIFGRELPTVNYCRHRPTELAELMRMRDVWMGEQKETAEHLTNVRDELVQRDMLVTDRIINGPYD